MNWSKSKFEDLEKGEHWVQKFETKRAFKLALDKVMQAFYKHPFERAGVLMTREGNKLVAIVNVDGETTHIEADLDEATQQIISDALNGK